MSNSDNYNKKKNNNIISSKKTNRKVEDEINKQINQIYKMIPKLLNKIAEYIKAKNQIYEEAKFITFAEKLRNINQNIYDLNLDMNTSFEIGENKDIFSSSLSYDLPMKYYEENKEYYENFYNQYPDIEINENEIINCKEEYTKSFLNSVEFLFYEFNYLLNSKNENLPYIPCLGSSNDSHIKFIKEIHNLLSSLNMESSISNYNNIEGNMGPRKIIYIKNMSTGITFSELKENTIENVDEFTTCIEQGISIDIIKLNTKNLNDLSFLNKTKLMHLKRLELRINNINDISPLKNCSCINLINLNISHNLLNNDSVEILLNMQLNNLLKLKLCDNKITTVKILKLGETFNKLKKFHIGQNLLNKTEIIENIHKFKFSESIENIGMSNNFNECFSNHNNIDLKFFNYITLENIKRLYLNRNDLYSLKCFEKNNFNKLEMVWLMFNHISDIEEIKYFHNINNIKTLKGFHLNGNNISSISDNFIKLLDEIFELNILNISLNPIKLENFKDKIEIIEKKGIRLLNL